MSYLKIQNNKIIEAPYRLEKDGKIIYGYNKNINMMLNDGFQFFPKSIYAYEISNGTITEKPAPQPAEQTIFSKLQIRRAMRSLGIENELNSILSGNPQFNTEWNDAQEIDLNDPLIQNAILNGLISQDTINKIKEAIQ